MENLPIEGQRRVNWPHRLTDESWAKDPEKRYFDWGGLGGVQGRSSFYRTKYCRYNFDIVRLEI